MAGGPHDKSWLLLRAWSKRQGIGDIADFAEPVFAAPPLLAEQMRNGSLDAVLIYWHFAAKLEAAGFQQLYGVDDIMRGLGISEPPPLIGFLYRKPVSAEQKLKFASFIRSVQAASRILQTSDAEWDRIRPLMAVKSDGEFTYLRKRFREGQLKEGATNLSANAQLLFEVMRQTGGEKVVGKGVRFDPQVFDSSSGQ